VAKDDPPAPPGVEVSVRLHNGTHILSREHKRVEDGYQVAGKLITKDNMHCKDFSGIVSDGQIREIVTIESDKVKTVSAVVATVLGVVVVLGLAVHSEMSR